MPLICYRRGIGSHDGSSKAIGPTNGVQGRGRAGYGGANVPTRRCLLQRPHLVGLSAVLLVQDWTFGILKTPGTREDSV